MGVGIERKGNNTEWSRKVTSQMGQVHVAEDEQMLAWQLGGCNYISTLAGAVRCCGGCHVIQQTQSSTISEKLRFL
jgi:hypothetical protein